MNLILFTGQDEIAPGRFKLSDRRFRHLKEILRAKVGDELKVGLENGDIGTATVCALDESQAVLEYRLRDAAPAPLPLQLIIGLPRPKFLARVLQTATALGAKDIHFINSYRVDKVYWSCAQLEPDAVRASCALGLEQARDTVFPTVTMWRRFKPFAEDVLPGLSSGTCRLLAHPAAEEAAPRGLTEMTTLIVGPEGGFIDYEISKLNDVGFKSVSLSPRVLKVETAIATLLGRLF